MEVIAFIIALVASVLGAIAGFGGGVIIKPVMDAFSFLPASSVSFLSGCTALAMAVSSLVQQRNNHIRLRYKTSTPLAIGAVLGGLVGNALLELIRNSFSGDAILGGTQAICLAVITAGVFVYICNKNKLQSFQIENVFFCTLIGVLLGVISAFLGIGGGTSNIAILFLCFSMDAKTAAKNSLYIIVFSQSASILKAIITGTVPDCTWQMLLLMVAGGVGGALLGSKIAKNVSNRGVELILKMLLAVMLIVNTTNIIKFFFS